MPDEPLVIPIPEVPDEPGPLNSNREIFGPADSPIWIFAPVIEVNCSEYVYVPAMAGESIHVRL